MKYYQVTITYPCDICGARHLVTKGSDSKIGEQEKNKLRESGFDKLRKDFNIKHPEDKFTFKRVIIEEVNQLGQVQNFPVEKIGAKYPNAIDKLIDGPKEEGHMKGEKKPEEVEVEPTAKGYEMSFEDIRNKVVARIAELIKTNKNCREAMDKLGIQFKETKVEILSLQSLLRATDQSINQYTKDKEKKKNGRKQKQKSKGK